MFGWMVTAVESHWLINHAAENWQLIQKLAQTPLLPSQQQPIEALVPTVVLPFALAAAIISSLFAAVAAWFGFQVKSNPAKQLLLFLLKPKILISALLLNAVILGGYQGYRYAATHSRPIWWIELQNSRFMESSDRTYPDNWHDRLYRNTGSSGPSRQLALAVTATAKLDTAWETKLSAGAFRGFSISGNSLFAATMKGFIYELDRETGKVIRKFYIGQPSVPQPVVFGGRLFVGEGEHLTHHARVYAFDLKTGKLAGAIQTKGHTEGDLTIHSHNDRAMLFIPAGADGLYAADPKTLEVIWHANYPHFDSGVTVHGNQVFFATGVEKGSEAITPALHAIDIESGKLNWKVDLGASGWSRPVIAGDRVCVGLGEIYSPRLYGQLACYSTKDGRNEVALNLGAPLFNTPGRIPQNNSGSDPKSDLIFANFQGEVCRFTSPLAQTLPQQRWCSKIPVKGKFLAWPAHDENGRVIVPTQAGITVFDAENGKVLTEWQPGEGSTPWGKFYAGVTAASDGWYFIDSAGTARKLVPRSN